MFTDARRNAKENGLQEGDLVLMKPKKTDKLSTNFNPNPIKIMSKGRNCVLVGSPEGVQYQRKCYTSKEVHKIGEKSK